MWSLFFLSFLLLEVGADWYTNDKALRWGPYRPNLYFGVRPQAPKTLLAGVMWASGDGHQNLLDTLRDTAQDNEVDGFGWTKYDTRTGGKHEVHDTYLNFDLVSEFVKTDDGENWAVRLSSGDSSPGKLALIFHVALEDMAAGPSKDIKCDSSQVDTNDGQLVAGCMGNDDTLGQFRMWTYSDKKNNIVAGPAMRSLDVPEDQIWQAKNLWKEELGKHENDVVLDDHQTGNIHFFQVVVDGSFQFDIVYGPADSETPLVPQDITDMLGKIDASFSADVDKVFPRENNLRDDRYTEFTQSALSQLLGGLAFLYGTGTEDHTDDPSYAETDDKFWEKRDAAHKAAYDDGKITTTDPKTLLTHTPSRTKFPRGFLWDEGFHLMAVMEWDLDLGVSVINSWLDLMNEDGWIGREQALGDEARSNVPEDGRDILVQYPQYANPPTLLLLLTTLMLKITKESPYLGKPSQYLASEDEGKKLLEELYPKFAKHADWFRGAQSGDLSDKYSRPDGFVPGEGYRWRGASPGGYCLPSGLDDYPRADPPHPGELHIDALAWVGASASALQKTADYLGKADEAKTYQDRLNNVLKNLDIIHWTNESDAWCDASIGDNNDFVHICHIGYVSLMPLFVGIMDGNHPKLESVLNLVDNADHIKTDFGLRSLSARDNYHNQESDYWRGALWMNFNTLAVLRLWDLGQQDGPFKDKAKQLAVDLRDRVVKTVFDSWDKTGYIWEQYDEDSGEGTHSHPFVGWTACVLLLLSLKEPDSSNVSSRATRSAVPLSPLGFAGAAMLILTIVTLRKCGSLRWTRPRRQHRYEEIIDLEDRAFPTTRE